jgi:hypothetical protein
MSGGLQPAKVMLRQVVELVGAGEAQLASENTDGLHRQYFPKNVDLSIYTGTELNAVARELNDRPRQTLGWMESSEVFCRAAASTSQAAAVFRDTSSAQPTTLEEARRLAGRGGKVCVPGHGKGRHAAEAFLDRM